MPTNEVSIAVKTDVSSATSTLNGLSKQFSDAGNKAGAAGVAAIQNQFKQLHMDRLQLSIDTASVTSQIAKLQSESAGLKLQIKAGVDVTAAKAQLDQITAQIAKLAKQKLEIRVDSTAAAQNMAVLRQQAAQTADAIEGQLTPAMGALNEQTARYGPLGAQSENTLTRLGTAANKASMNVYFASFGLTALGGLSPKFELLGQAVANTSGFMSLAGPIMEMVGRKTQAMGAATQAAATQVVTADAEMVAANREVAASTQNAGSGFGGIGAIAGGAALGLGVLTAVMSANSAAAAADEQAIQGYAKALLDSGGIITDTIQKQQALAVASSESFGKSNVEILAKYGIGLKTIQAAATGDKGAMDQINAAVLHQGVLAGTAASSVEHFANQIDRGKSEAAQASAALSGTSGVIEDLAGSLHDATAAWAGLNATIGQDVSGLIDQSNATINAALTQDQFNDSLANFNQTLNGSGGGGGSSTKKAVQAVVDVLGDYNDQLDKLSNNNIDAKEAQDKFNLSLLDFKTNLADATPLKDQTGAVLLNTRGAINNRDAVLDQIQAINGIASAQLKAGVSASTVTANMKTNEAALVKNATAAGLARREVEALIKQYATNPAGLTPAVQAKEKADAAAAAAKAAADAENAYGGAVGNTTIKLAAGRDAVLARLQDINSVAQAEINAGVPIDQVTKHLQNNEAQLLKTGTQAGLTKKEVQGLITQYGLVPKEITTKVTADTQEAKDKLAVMVALEDVSQGRGSPMEIAIANEAEANLKGNSTGGIWSAAVGGNRSGWGTINERGTEAVRLPNGSTVITAEDTQARGLNGGGAQSVMIGFDWGSASGSAESFLLDLLRNIIRVRGGNVQTVLGRG